MGRPDSCPLCAGSDVEHVAAGTVARQSRDYWLCEGCRLVFVCRQQLPGPEAELARYREHDNDPDDPDYREHLAPVARAVRARLAGGARGLDYGAGPGPALAAMLEEAGYAVRIYDPFFERDPAALERRYDFVTCTETAEHFHRPAEEFRRLDGLLRPGGWLFVMTSLYERPGQFPEWWYSRDPTHVSFYHRHTMRWIAAERRWDADFPEADVVAFRKAYNEGMERQRRIEETLTRQLAPVHLEVIDETHMHDVPPDAESHFRVRVVSDSFDGKPLVQRHRAVYAALAEEIGGDGGIHALGLDTLTPDEWAGGDRGQESPPCLGGSKEG